MSFTKIKDMKNLSLQEIEDKIQQIKIEILNLKIKAATRQTIKNHTFKHKKHELAQILTEKGQRAK